MIQRGGRIARAAAAWLCVAIAACASTPCFAAYDNDLSNFNGHWPCDAGVLMGRPKTLADVQHLVSSYPHVKATGKAHSWAAQHFCSGAGADAASSVNVLMESIDPLRIVLDTERREVTADAGVCTRTLLDWLANYPPAPGWSLPAIPWYINQTVAGAVATATHGSSLRYGSLSAQMTRLTAVIANGSIITVGEQQHPELFRAWRTSVGRLGIITSVTFKVLPNDAVRRWQQIYSFTELTDYIGNITDASFGRGSCMGASDVIGCAQLALEQLDEAEAFCNFAQQPSGRCHLMRFKRLPGVVIGGGNDAANCSYASSDQTCLSGFQTSVNSALPPEGWPVPSYLQRPGGVGVPPPASVLLGQSQRRTADGGVEVTGGANALIVDSPLNPAAETVFSDIFESQAEFPHLAEVVLPARDAYESVTQTNDATITSLGGYDQYEASVAWKDVRTCFTALAGVLFGPHQAWTGFRDLTNIRFVGVDDGLLSYTWDGPRAYLNVEDWVKYSQGNAPNVPFQLFWSTLLGPSCHGRPHWGKTGQRSPQCFVGTTAYGRNWCSFGCAVRAMDPGSKFASAGHALWDWTGVDLVNCCGGPDGAVFSASCTCTVQKTGCDDYLTN